MNRKLLTLATVALLSVSGALYAGQQKPKTPAASTAAKPAKTAPMHTTSGKRLFPVPLMMIVIVIGAVGFSGIFARHVHVLESSAHGRGQKPKPSVSASQPKPGPTPRGPEIAQIPGSTPPPPARPSGNYNYQTGLDHERALSGMTIDELRRIQQYLPNGSQVALYAVDEKNNLAAIGKADLENNGVLETIVIYRPAQPINDASSSPLNLAVLVPEQDRLVVRASTTLYGSYIQN